VPLTPTDIHNKEFHRGFRGYAEQEVDEFLDSVVLEFEALLRDRDQMRVRADEAEQNLARYKQVEEHLQKALVMAEKTSDEMRQNAKHEAELLVRDAQQKADQLLDEARGELRTLERDLMERRREIDIWKAKVRSMLESELALLADDAGSAAATGSGN